MDELPIVTRLNEIAAHESGLSPIVKLRDEHIADVRQAAALIRAQHEALESVMAYARALRKSSELVGPREYQDQPKLYRAWVKANYHAGKDIMERTRAALAKAKEV